MDRKVQEFDKKNNSRTITHGKYVISILNVFYPSHSSNQKFLWEILNLKKRMLVIFASLTEKFNSHPVNSVRFDLI